MSIRSVARRLEFVADPTLSLPECALAAWHSSGVEERGERRVGPGDLGGVMQTYGELVAPRAAARGRRACAQENTRTVRVAAALALARGRRRRDRARRLSTPAVKPDQWRPALRHRQTHPSRAAGHWTVCPRERRDRAVSEQVCA